MSASPKEFLLNLLPQGGFDAGTVYHPLANVLLYFFSTVGVVKLSIVVYAKSLNYKGIFPLFNINCIKRIILSGVENKPAFPA